MGKHQPKRLILACNSAARRELLERAGYQFDVRPANIAEPTALPGLDARGFVQLGRVLTLVPGAATNGFARVTRTAGNSRRSATIP